MRNVGEGVREIDVRCPEVSDGQGGASPHVYCRAFVRPYIAALDMAPVMPDLEFFMSWTDCVAFRYVNATVTKLLSSVAIFAQASLGPSLRQPHSGAPVLVPNMHDLDRIWHFFSLVAVKVGDIPWEEKSDLLLWRGTPAAQYGEAQKANSSVKCWLSFKHVRWRLVMLSTLFPDVLDAKFTRGKSTSWDPLSRNYSFYEDCSATDIEYLEKIGVFGESIEPWQGLRARYVIPAEGSAGHDDRWLNFVRSGSLMLKHEFACEEWLHA